MKLPKLNTGHDTFRDYTVYTTAQLKAGPGAEIKALAPALRGAWDLLDAAENTHRAMEDAMVAAMAMRDRADGATDDYLRAQFRLAQGVYGVKSRGIKALYPDGLTPLIKGPIPEQPSQMRVHATRVEGADNETVAAAAELIREKAASLEEAVVAFDLAVEQVAMAWAQLLKARGEWIRIYEKTYGELVALVGKKQAEGYFKKAGKRNK